TNGIIHVIDSVILPPDKDIVDTLLTTCFCPDPAVSENSFNTLAAALTEAGLVETLKGEGPFTVFAPTDEAFANLPEGTIPALLADKEALTNVLLYHVAGESLPASKVLELGSIPTVQGKNVEITLDMGKAMANNAQIIVTDI